MSGESDQADLNLGLPHLLYLARKRRGWNQYEASFFFGIQQPSYSRWESGKNRPGPDQYAKVAEFLGVSERQVAAMKHEIDVSSDDPSQQAARLAHIEQRVEDLESRLSQFRRYFEAVVDDLASRAGNPLGRREFTSDRDRQPPAQDHGTN